MSSAKAFIELFRCYHRAYGRHTLNMDVGEDGKHEGKAETVTLPSDVALLNQHIERHLAGTGPSIGGIPLLEDNTVFWGAIDLDIRGQHKLREPPEDLERRISALGLPLVVCRSKSGGAHLYCFFVEPAPGKLVQDKLNEWAAALGYGGTEVFPKQTSRVDDRDVGNWINFPYYDATKTVRPCLVNGESLSLEKFLEYAHGRRITVAALRAVKIELKGEFADGPPCLQHLATVGFDHGGRNAAMFNVGVYMRRKHPDDWQDLLFKFNYENMIPPMTQKEVGEVIKSLTKKDYHFTCKQPPICNHCHKRACMKREFGIGWGRTKGGAAGLQLEGLTASKSLGTTRWYADFEGIRFPLTTEDLLDQRRLQKIILERFQRVMYPMKTDEWLEAVEKLVENVEVVEAPEDASTEGQFENLLDAFLTRGALARDRDEIIKGNCWLNEAEQRIVFRSEDLLSYLRSLHFTSEPMTVWGWVKGRGGESTQLRVKGKKVRVWTLPKPEFYEESALKVPNMEEEF